MLLIFHGCCILLLLLRMGKDKERECERGVCLRKREGIRMNNGERSVDGRCGNRQLWVEGFLLLVLRTVEMGISLFPSRTVLPTCGLIHGLISSGSSLALYYFLLSPGHASFSLTQHADTYAVILVRLVTPSAMLTVACTSVCMYCMYEHPSTRPKSPEHPSGGGLWAMGTRWSPPNNPTKRLDQIRSSFQLS